MITIFDTRYTFYEIEGLDSDLLIGYNILKKKKLWLIQLRELLNITE